VLQFHGLQIEEMRVLVFKGKAPVLVTGSRLLDNSTGFQSWGLLSDAQKQWLQTEDYDAFD
jgi:hypothetical protein